jgi:hypothetical protein
VVGTEKDDGDVGEMGEGSNGDEEDGKRADEGVGGRSSVEERMGGARCR